MPIMLQGNDPADLPTESLYTLSLAIHDPSQLILLRPLVAKTLTNGAGIFSLLSIAYSNWPRLRCRLTLSG